MKKDVEIKKAGIKGKGVFALRNLKKGETITQIEGKVIETEEPSRLSKCFQDHCFPLGKKGKKYLYVSPQSPWKYINHSCEPNTGIKNDSEFVAIRDIKRGEEISFDYSTNNFDFDMTGWTMKCHCGSKKCRKIISTFNKLDKKSQRKLKEYLLTAVREKYLGH